MKMYMHILNDKPAFFDGEQIVYMSRGRKINKIRIVKDLKTIRRQQRLCEIFRKSIGCYDFNTINYSYVIIEVKL